MACTAVGDYSTDTGDPAADVTLAEHWNGIRWEVQRTPAPVADGSSLGAVACTSAARCTAVGNTSWFPGGPVALAERWNGKIWGEQAAQPTRISIVEPYGPLLAVACTSVVACTAVGGGGLAERWNGERWTVQPTPSLQDSSYGDLLGLACPSAKACTAVGYTFQGIGGSALAERRHGNDWTIQLGAIDYYSEGYSELKAVACPTANDCLAVGGSSSGGSTEPNFGALAERWNGKHWKVQSSDPAGSSGGWLGDVACTSAAACTAVGGYMNAAGTGVTLATQWNGQTWAIQPTPNLPGATDSRLLAAACTSAAACTAVGSYTNRRERQITLAERWNGQSWAIQSTPNPRGGAHVVLGPWHVHQPPRALPSAATSIVRGAR